MTYRIELSPEARKALLAVAARDRRRLERAIDGLARNPRPRGARKLEGGAGELRARVGVYRIVYEVDDPVLRVRVLRIGHRREACRRS